MDYIGSRSHLHATGILRCTRKDPATCRRIRIRHGEILTCITCGKPEAFDATRGFWGSNPRRRQSIRWACQLLPHECLRCAYDRCHPRSERNLRRQADSN